MNNNIDKRKAFDINADLIDARDSHEEPKGYGILGGSSDFFDADGYPVDAQINVVKKIKIGPFLITVQRRLR